MDDFVKVVKTIMKITQNNNKNTTEAEKLLTDLKKKLSDFLKEYPYELYFNFDYEFTRFSEFVKFPDFAERNIIGIGGKFSSGKSSFLNALLDEKILPVDTTPTTSIPTFIGNGKEFTVVLNIFNNLIEIDKTDLKNLKHYNSEEIEYSFSHLLKKIFIKTQQTEYKNLVFLDTPGYSKGEAEDYSENTDKKIAKVQLNNSNFIIWLVDADNGTISKEDIDFLKSLNREIEILIVVTKADKKQTEIDSILKYIKNEISLMGLNVIDVLPFSARKKNLFPIENIKKYIDKWNKNKINVLFAKNFKSFFIEISNLLNTEEEELRKELNKINIAKAYSDNNYVLNELNVLNKITINKLEQIKTQKSKLENFNLYFFDMIKKIGYLTNVNIEETPILIKNTSSNYNHDIFVNVDNKFLMSKFQVTQKEYYLIMGKNPSHFKGDNLPVEQVNLYDAMDYCNKKSIKDKLQPVYTILGNYSVSINRTKNGYRLPTEEEWKYAAKGGSLSKRFTYSGSNKADEVAWYYANSGKKTHDVGTKKPNELGIYDMSGNVWEWMDTISGVLFGGGLYNDACDIHIYSSYDYNPNDFDYDFGFRVVQSL